MSIRLFWRPKQSHEHVAVGSNYKYEDVQEEYRLISEEDVYCNSIMASLDPNTYSSICTNANSAKDQINFEVE